MSNLNETKKNFFYQTEYVFISAAQFCILTQERMGIHSVLEPASIGQHYVTHGNQTNILQLGQDNIDIVTFITFQYCKTLRCCFIILLIL